MQPGNGLPSGRTGGPAKNEMTVICLGRQRKDVHHNKSEQTIPEFSGCPREACSPITLVKMSCKR